MSRDYVERKIKRNLHINYLYSALHSTEGSFTVISGAIFCFWLMQKNGLTMSVFHDWSWFEHVQRIHRRELQENRTRNYTSVTYTSMHLRSLLCDFLDLIDGNECINKECSGCMIPYPEYFPMVHSFTSFKSRNIPTKLTFIEQPTADFQTRQLVITSLHDSKTKIFVHRVIELVWFHFLN